MKNYYQTLGIPHNAKPEDIKRAYMEYASNFEPARHNNSPFFTERFKEVLTAYEVLIDPVRRQEYDIENHAAVVSEAALGRARALRSNNFLFFLLGLALAAGATYGWMRWQQRTERAEQETLMAQIRDVQKQRTRTVERVNGLIRKEAYPQAIQVADSALKAGAAGSVFKAPRLPPRVQVE